MHTISPTFQESFNAIYMYLLFVYQLRSRWEINNKTHIPLTRSVEIDSVYPDFLGSGSFVVSPVWTRQRTPVTTTIFIINGISLCILSVKVILITVNGSNKGKWAVIKHKHATNFTFWSTKKLLSDLKLRPGRRGPDFSSEGAGKRVGFTRFHLEVGQRKSAGNWKHNRLLFLVFCLEWW